MRFLALSFLFLVPSFETDPDDVIGIWLTDDGKAKIEIYEESGRYSGKIIWIRDSVDDAGRPRLDKENPKKALQGRPIVGIDLVKGFKFRRGRWEGGEIYDPENGKTYSCKMTLIGNKLEVRGYIGFSMFGRTVVWTRTE